MVGGHHTVRNCVKGSLGRLRTTAGGCAHREERGKNSWLVVWPFQLPPFHVKAVCDDVFLITFLSVNNSNAAQLSCLTVWFHSFWNIDRMVETSPVYFRAFPRPSVPLPAKLYLWPILLSCILSPSQPPCPSCPRGLFSLDHIPQVVQRVLFHDGLLSSGIKIFRVHLCCGRGPYVIPF